MKYLFERMDSPATEWDQADYERAVRNQVQRLAEGHQLARSDSSLDLFSLELGHGSMPSAVCDLGSDSKNEHLLYARRLEKIIAKYEKRLMAAKVSVAYTGSEKNIPHLVIEGILALPDSEERFRFPLELDS